MELCYYPGCTLKTTAKNFETPAIASMENLGHKLVELPRWNCCGTVYSLAADDLMHQLAPVRTLIRVLETGADKVVTLCAMCYNTLKQTNRIMLDDDEKRDCINKFLDEEKDYSGNVSIFHLLEFLRDEVGFDKIKNRVKRPLDGLELSPFYGCLLLRPEGIGIDDIEAPKVMEDFINALGGKAVESPFKIECCGSYHTVDDIEPVVERTKMIIDAARIRSAEAIVVGCPLGFFNLDYRQKNVEIKNRVYTRMPVFYFTQLLAIALGLGSEVCNFDLNYVDPQPLLEKKGLIKIEN
ncbi:MAG: CoB--CoM heterodisulfide reductase iron-sulfur subunit B family protein [Thermoplasmatales archaeon]|nr:MAG: CoB--CoM heterodisulfide reductase iron-sulfur subunit B family protein [Thermoplasmatales archaeon]